MHRGTRDPSTPERQGRVESTECVMVKRASQGTYRGVRGIAFEHDDSLARASSLRLSDEARGMYIHDELRDDRQTDSIRLSNHPLRCALFSHVSEGPW